MTSLDLLSERVKTRLLLLQRTVAVAESVTSGHLQAAITATTGASEYFVGGITAYTLDSKVELLNVERVHAEPVDCVSALVAEQMAAGAATCFRSHYAIATTGYAEPYPQRGVTSPFAFVAVLQRDPASGFIITPSRFDSDHLSRIDMQKAIAAFALSNLLQVLEADR